MSRIAEVLPLFVRIRPEVWSTRPFSFKLGTNPWSVVTDGQWLVAVPGKSPFSPIDEPAGIATILRCSPKNPVVAKMETLREWAGAAPSAPSPSFPREEPTDDKPEPDGALCGVVIDRRRLAYILQHLTFPEVTIWNSTSQLGVRSVGILAQHWRIYLAGVDGDVTEEHAKFPPLRVEPEAPEEDVFALMSSMGSE